MGNRFTQLKHFGRLPSPTIFFSLQSMRQVHLRCMQDAHFRIEMVNRMQF